jgi:hypothetical protein
MKQTYHPALRTCAAALLVLTVATLAATFLPPDCDGLPGFDDDDGGSDAPSLWIRIAVTAGPGRTTLVAPPQLWRLAEVAAAAVLPDGAPPRNRPSRSPPGS